MKARRTAGQSEKTFFVTPDTGFLEDLPHLYVGYHGYYILDVKICIRDPKIRRYYNIVSTPSLADLHATHYYYLDNYVGYRHNVLKYVLEMNKEIYVD